MAIDDLNTPLARTEKKRRRFALPVMLPRLLAGALALVVLTFAGWAVLVDDPLGGEPMAVVATAPAPAAAPAPALPTVVAGTNAVIRSPDKPASAPTPAVAPPPGGQTVVIIDGSTGKRLEVPIPPPQDSRAPAEQRFLEVSRHGLIPKIGPDGTKPAEVYARAVKGIPNKPDAPRIAIVIGGLGISATATQDAITKLPAPVTFAFLPYGAEVERAVTRARADGHELLLQAPMEPSDYPDNDPGPQTLLHSLSIEQNLDRLHWSMSRFQGYVGVANFMGARLTSSEPALSPILREIGKRGLIYFDDSSSSRSLTGQIAGANNLPFARADVILDSVTSPAHIDKALSRLEATARERGSAIGVAAALPSTIARIAQWTKAAESRGILLVPITAIASKPKSS